MWTGLTDSPGVTVELGEPGVIGVVTVPGVVGGTGLPGSGVTGACSEYTGRLTGDC